MKLIHLCWCLALLPGHVSTAAAGDEKTRHPAGPAKVEVRKTSDRWQLYVNQRPFYIKGAGLEFGDQEKLAAHGANSLRTWRTENGRQSGRAVLDRALKNGLYVTMGLDIARERHGFDYSDANAVARQLADVKSQVLKYKNHPALLLWDIGNELNLNATNPQVWNAVNEISRMIHEVDPNHLTTTSLAGINKDLIDQIKNRAPDLDLLAIQMYADIVNLPRYLRESGWTGPYVITEWGATGHWEAPTTTWQAPIEEDSTAKAEAYGRRYEVAVAADTRQCLGSYVFLWGQKQERTPTWYGMFLESGEETEAVDVLHHIWTGKWPESRCPRLEGFWLDGKTARDNIRLQAGQIYPVKVLAQTFDPTRLSYSWEIMQESGAKTTGGDSEAKPLRLEGLVAHQNDGQTTVKAPAKAGAYRLFVFITTGAGKAAYANIPFYVETKAAATARR